MSEEQPDGEPEENLIDNDNDKRDQINTHH